MEYASKTLPETSAARNDIARKIVAFSGYLHSKQTGLNGTGNGHGGPPPRNSFSTEFPSSKHKSRSQPATVTRALTAEWRDARPANPKNK